MNAHAVAQQTLPLMPDPTLRLADLAQALRGSARAQSVATKQAARVKPGGPRTLDELADLLEGGNIASQPTSGTGGASGSSRSKSASSTRTGSVQPRPMADCSAMVWFPWPDEWPMPSIEEITADAQRRARYYCRKPKGAK